MLFRSRKWRCRADDVAPEADPLSVLGGQQVCADRVFEVDAPMEILGDFHIVVSIPLAHCRVEIRLREEARGPEYDAGQSMVSMKQLAEILRRCLGDPVDVLGPGFDVLGDPLSRITRRRDQGVAKNARRAGKDKRPDIGRRSLFQEIEGAGSEIGRASCRERV